MLSSSSSQFALSVSEEMEWKQAFAALRPKTKMTKPRKRGIFLKEASFLLCLSIVQKKWSLVRVEVLGKNQQSHT